MPEVSLVAVDLVELVLEFLHPPRVVLLHPDEQAPLVFAELVVVEADLGEKRRVDLGEKPHVDLGEKRGWGRNGEFFFLLGVVGRWGGWVGDVHVQQEGKYGKMTLDLVGI